VWCGGVVQVFALVLFFFFFFWAAGYQK